MSEFKRQHPVAAISRVVDLIRGNLITIIIVLVFGASGGGTPSFHWVFLGLMIFLLVAGVVGWWRFVYRVEEGELQIKQGILVRKNLYLTRDRVQVIDVTAGVVQRLFGLVKVEIKTAGSSSREASLSAVSRSEADYLTHLLRGNGEAIAGETATDGTEVHDRQNFQEPDVQRYALPGKELLIAASTSGSFGIALSILATIFSQIEPILDESAIGEWLFQVLPSEADTFFIVTVILIFVVFAWLMSFFGTLIRYGDFTLTVKKDEMVVRRGIFEKKQITVPFNRIQALRIVEGTMRQPLGYATLHVESAGYGDQRESGSVALFPLIKKSEVHAFLENVIPDYTFDLQSVRPPKRAITRYIIRSSAVIAAILAFFYWLLGSPGWIWFLMIPGMYWGWLRYKDAAVSTNPGKMILRSRVLARTTAVVQRNRAQDITTSSSWIQQYRNLANLEVSVASGDQGRSFQVRELEKSDVAELLPWITREYGQRVVSREL